MTLNELYAQKAAAWRRFREIQDAADVENRATTAEERAEQDRCNADIEEADKAIADLNDQQARRVRLLEVERSLKEMPQANIQARGTDGAETKPDTRTLSETLRDYTGEGMSRREALDRIAKEKGEAAAAKRAAFCQWLKQGFINPQLRERAALQMDKDADGGFLVAPEQFLAQLIQDMDNMVPIRQFCTVISLTGAESLGVPTLDTDISDTNWTTELKIGTADSSMVFGKRRLTPHPLAKNIYVSKDLLRSAALSVDAIVRERMAYKFSTVQETAFCTGNGAGQPLGMFTASSNGVSTGRDVSTGNTSTSIQTDGLIECKYALTSPWLNSPNLRWVFHRTAVKQIRTLKDGDGQYLWQPGLVADRPDSILGVPIVISEYAPSTFTTGLYVGIIGDLSYYWIAESMQMEIQRLVELGAATNQDIFVGRVKLDGMPVLEEAFSRVKLG